MDRNHSHFIFLDRNIKTSDYMKKLQNKLYDYADNEENSNHGIINLECFFLFIDIFLNFILNFSTNYADCFE
jgi:hypothetical protein